MLLTHEIYHIFKQCQHEIFSFFFRSFFVLSIISIAAEYRRLFVRLMVLKAHADGEYPNLITVDMSLNLTTLPPHQNSATLSGPTARSRFFDDIKTMFLGNIR